MATIVTYKPRATRIATDMAASLTGERCGTIAVTVVNISAAGCGLKTDHPFAPGDRIRLQIGAQAPCDAEIRWFGNGAAGAQFTAPPAPL